MKMPPPKKSKCCIHDAKAAIIIKNVTQKTPKGHAQQRIIFEVQNRMPF